MDEPLDLSEVDRIVARIGGAAECVLPLLQAVQAHYHYLPIPALKRVSALTGIAPSAIAGVSTFYAQFRHKPAGRHNVRVCVGTACHVKGAGAVLESFRRLLGIEGEDDTDAERLFTVQKVACLGCCMLAPVVQIDDVIYGAMAPEKVAATLGDFLRSARASASHGPGTGAGRGRGEVRLCCCSSCGAAGAESVFRQFADDAKDLGLTVPVRSVGCTGASFDAPLVHVAGARGDEYRYGRVRPGDCRRILLRHFAPARLLPRLSATIERVLGSLVDSGAQQDGIVRYAADVRDGRSPWGAAGQVHVATEHGGQMGPLAMDEYEAHDGFQAWQGARVTAPDDVVARISDSGLRGRGGAGYPTGRKWAAVRAAAGRVKYVICNGDEGDPGAFMDRMILESFPYRVIEGLLVACHAVGAREGIFYIREEYPLAVRRVREAIQRFEGSKAAEDAPRMRVAEGAGAFVCGEETALIAALEGRRGTPVYRPPYPAESGLHGCPTLVNNVETLALVPWILRHGPAAFAAMGSRGSAGTKTFALAGRVRRGGLIEVPMGTPMRAIVEDLGGGAGEGRRVKAVQIGGPSGGCLPAALSDLPVDYEALVEAGAIMGSGGLVVLDDTDCMVDVARYFLEFTQHESCGKCTFCRVGTRRMLDMLEALCAGRAGRDTLAELEQLALAVRAGSLCGLGRTAPNSVLSTLRYFRGEYEAHAQGGCPAGKCKALIRYAINEKCIGCTRCAQRCPVDAIPMRPYERHEIDQALCTRCDTCRKVCPAGAVEILPRAAKEPPQ
jgi:NADH-quinone oxidoreductase subunit F